jgi:EpsI family protein
MKHAIGVDHIIYGWIFFGVVIGLMFLVGSRYRDDDQADLESIAIEVPDTGSVQPGKLVFAVFVAVAATTFGPLASQALATRYTEESELSNGLPNTVAGWQGTVMQDSAWVPSFIGATQESLVRYQRSEVQVDVALIRYSGQRQGSELANSSNSIIGSNGWRQRNIGKLNIELGDGKSVQLSETLAARHGTVRRFWYWYEVDGNSVVSDLKVKLYEAQSLITGRPAISSAIIVSVIENSSGTDVLQTYMNDAYNAISECLAAAVPRKGCQLGSIPASSETHPKQN